MTTEPTSPDGPVDPQLREEVALRHVTDELTAEYAEEHAPDEVEQVVEEAIEQYADAPVRDFVPSLVEREARQRLTESE